MTERRKDRRLIDNDIVVLTWQNGEGCVKQLGTLENFSHNGLGLVVGKILPVMTDVTVSYNGNELHGIIRHVESRKLGYFLGIEFASETLPLALQFPPELFVQQYGTHWEKHS